MYVVFFFWILNAYAAPQIECEYKRLNAEIPVFHQEDSVMCGAHSTAQVISSMTSRAISPIWLSLAGGSLGYQDPIEVLEGMRKKDFLCAHDPILEPTPNELEFFTETFVDASKSLKKSFKNISILASSDRFKDRLKSLAKKDGFATTDEYLKNLTHSKITDFKDKVQPLFKKLFLFGGMYTADFKKVDSALNRYIESLEKGEEPETYSFVRHLYDMGYAHFCAKNKVSLQGVKNTVLEYDGEQLKNMSCPHIQKLMDQEIEKGTPTVIGLHFSVMYNKDLDERGTDHYLTVVGKRCSAQGPEYLIRNSYGKTCLSHYKNSDKIIPWSCDPETGEFWLPVDKLCKNVSDLYLFRKE